MKKGQMFLVTMVFLAGLIFAVQGYLLQYTSINLASPYQQSDYYVIAGIKGAFQKTLQTSGCNADNLNELQDWFESKFIKGYSVGLNWTCANSQLNLTINMIGPATESRTNFVLV